MSYFLHDARVRYEEVHDPEHKYTFIGPCIVTGKVQRVTVAGHDLYQYNQGKLLQNAFPYLTSDEREWMISGYSKEGRDQMFGTTIAKGSPNEES